MTDLHALARADLAKLADGLRARLVDGPEPTLAELSCAASAALCQYGAVTPRPLTGILTELCRALTAADNLTASTTSRITELCDTAQTSPRSST